MGFFVYPRRGLVLFMVLAGAWLGGCQVTPPVPTRTFIVRQSLLDLTGLVPPAPVEDVAVSWAHPRGWEQLVPKKTALYAHQQWRSPSGATGVGVVRIRMPLALSANTIIWFARNEYVKSSRDQKDGKLIGQWSDDLGRVWFEAENNKYHVLGYAVTRGRDAWIVYSGWRTGLPPEPTEISIARRSAETVVPGVTGVVASSERK